MDGLERVLHGDPLLRTGASTMGTAHLNNGAGIHSQQSVAQKCYSVMRGASGERAIQLLVMAAVSPATRMSRVHH